MQRRTLLRGFAAAVVGASAGCTSNNREVPATAAPPPEEIRDSGDGGGNTGENDSAISRPFIVPERDFLRGEDDNLIVIVTVQNREATPQTGVMTVQIRAGDKTFAPVRKVSLEPGAQRAFRISVPVAYSEFKDFPGFDVQFELGEPETPLPEGTVTPYPEGGANETLSTVGGTNGTSSAESAISNE